MTELYLSDMDGTLLNREGQLSAFTRRTLGRLLSKGLPFTVATGRTPLSALPLLSGLSLHIPLVLMNGALILDPVTGCTLSATPLNADARAVLARAAASAGLGGLLLFDSGRTVSAALDTPLTPLWSRFFARNRVNAGDIPVRPACAAALPPILYGIYLDGSPRRLSMLRDLLSAHPGFTLDFYQDRYDSNTWCLELYSSAASKYHAARQLRALTGAGRLIAFGDSENDLPLFRACDVSYAVGNAQPQVKKAAHGIIGSHTEDGVARFLESDWGAGR